jgi:RecA/RadA recombinase
MAIGTGGAGLHGRVLAAGLQKLAVAVIRSGVALVFLNQTRSRMDVIGDADTSAGGASLKLYAAVRIALEPAGAGQRALSSAQKQGRRGVRTRRTALETGRWLRRNRVKRACERLSTKKTEEKRGF